MNLRDLERIDASDPASNPRSSVIKLGDNKQLISLLNNIKTIVIITDSHGEFDYITPSFDWFLGYRIEDLCKKRFINYVHPDDADKIASSFRMALNLEGSSLNLPQFRFRHKRGAWIYLEGDINNRIHDHLVKGLVLNLYDVTQQKLFELDYARLLGAIRTSTDSFMLTDNDGNIIFVNDATMQILGTSRSELIGKNISYFIYEEDLRELFKQVELNKGHIKSAEHRFIASNGFILTVESSVAIMRDSDKKNIGFVFI